MVERAPHPVSATASQGEGSPRVILQKSPFPPEVLARLTEQTGLGTPELLHKTKFTRELDDGTEVVQAGSLAEMLLSGDKCPVGGMLRSAYAKGGFREVLKTIGNLRDFDEPDNEADRFDVPISQETFVREVAKYRTIEQERD
jgi:hypothetical protein